MKNMIGGTVEQISWDQLIELADKEIRATLCKMAEPEEIAGVVMYEVLQMDSSQVGHRQFMICGPTCTYTLEKAIAGRLGDVPSRFAYPVKYWSRA